jgi:hypothetical protein
MLPAMARFANGRLLVAAAGCTCCDARCCKVPDAKLFDTGGGIEARVRVKSMTRKGVHARLQGPQRLLVQQLNDLYQVQLRMSDAQITNWPRWSSECRRWNPLWSSLVSQQLVHPASCCVLRMSTLGSSAARITGGAKVSEHRLHAGLQSRFHGFTPAGNGR